MMMLWGLALAAHGGLAAGPAMSATVEGDEVVVRVADEVFTAYRFAPGLKYPYFWPVNGPASGESVTTHQTEPYPHHSSLWLACDRVNGANYWQEANDRGQIVSQGPEVARESDGAVVITDRCLWRVPGEEPVIEDARRFTITAPDDDTRIIDADFVLTPLVEVTIRKTNHSLFAARLAPALSVEAGGTLVNAEGATGEAGTWGKAAPWCDYHGEREGVREGLAIFQHPENPWHPAPWFTRDYGFFSPTPMYWLDDDRLVLPEGEPVRLRYRVVVHAGATGEAAMAAQYANYAGEPHER
jgi:hypothetical protein